MRRSVSTLLILAAVICLQWTSALAFHDEGVARCGRCHTMHNTNGSGGLVDPTGTGFQYLLTYSNSTDLCLSCHGDHLGAVWMPDPLAPGAERGPGNFSALQLTDIEDGSSVVPGWRGGHTVISPSKGIVADALNPTAPGGTFPASLLTCTSCHDPHGNENYRMLYSDGMHEVNGYAFTEDAPDATGLAFSGADSLTRESLTNHIAYRGGMSAWCSNCHGNFHNNTTQKRHPSGVVMSGPIAAIYNRYNGTMDQWGAVQATSYIPEVAFEDPDMTNASTNGPDANSQVACISCHRAHASQAQNSGRWDFNVTFRYNENTSGLYRMPMTYDNPNQRNLCNKCHNKDAGDHNPY